MTQTSANYFILVRSNLNCSEKTMINISRPLNWVLINQQLQNAFRFSPNVSASENFKIEIYDSKYKFIEYLSEATKNEVLLNENNVFLFQSCNSLTPAAHELIAGQKLVLSGFDNESHSLQQDFTFHVYKYDTESAGFWEDRFVKIEMMVGEIQCLNADKKVVNQINFSQIFTHGYFCIQEELKKNKLPNFSTIPDQQANFDRSDAFFSTGFCIRTKNSEFYFLFAKKRVSLCRGLILVRNFSNSMKFFGISCRNLHIRHLQCRALMKRIFLLNSLCKKQKKSQQKHTAALKTVRCMKLSAWWRSAYQTTVMQKALQSKFQMTYV